MTSGHTDLSAAFSPMDLLKLLETAHTKFSWNYLLSQALQRYNARNWFPSANLIYSPMHTRYNSVFNWPVSGVHGGWIQTVGSACRPMPNATLKEQPGCKGWVLKGTERRIWLFRQKASSRQVNPSFQQAQQLNLVETWSNIPLLFEYTEESTNDWCTVKKDIAEAMRAYNKRKSEAVQLLEIQRS